MFLYVIAALITMLISYLAYPKVPGFKGYGNQEKFVIFSTGVLWPLFVALIVVLQLINAYNYWKKTKG